MVVGIVQRIDAGRFATGDAALVRAREPGATRHLLLVAGRRGARISVVDGDALATARAALRVERHPQEAHWRARLDGMRVFSIEKDGVAFERDGEHQILVCDGITLALRSWEAASTGEHGVVLPDGAVLAAELAAAAVDGRRAALMRALNRAVTKLERRAEAVRGDLGRIAKAEETAARAQLFVAQAAHAARGARALSAVDWTSGEPVTIEMPLDPARSAREQLDTIFKRARRLKDGGRIGRLRLAETETLAAGLRALVSETAASTELAALDTMAERARAIAPRDFRGASPSGEAPARRAAKGAQPALPPFRVFHGARAARILVGRGAAHNDELTFHVAKPHDLWLHAKGRTGAHVIVPLSKGASCPPDLLADAAHLAAHFSEARDETTVEVQHTPRRYLRKPRGSAPGLVVVDREKVIVLRREEDRLRVLLESESV